MQPLLVASLIRSICQRLLALLKSLNDDDWQRPTSSSRRTVKDVASHLLDGSLRRLSMQRDRYVSPNPTTGIQADEPLLEYLNRLNDEWDTATRRLSPSVLIGLLEWADPQLATLFESLDPQAPAIFPVAWAGEGVSENWMDVARDYTEKWHHTQQIFEATGRPSTITGRDLFHPCLDAFVRALPFTFRDVEADLGTTVALVATGDAGSAWFIERTRTGWIQISQAAGPVASTVTIDSLDLWRLVTKRRSRDAVIAAFPGIRIEGDPSLGGHVLDMVSMMA